MKAKVLKISLFSLALFFLFSEPVQAYIDPATTSYLIQIVSALVITLGVTAGIFFSRIRLFFLNSRVKLAEWRIRLFSKEARTRRLKKDRGPLVDFPESPSGRWRYLWEDNRPYPSRFFLAASPTLCLFFTFTVFGVYELYVTNQSSFAFPLNPLIPTLLLIAITGTLLLAASLSLFRGRLFDGLASLLFGLVLAANIQGNLLNQSLGELTGDAIPWETHQGEALLNLLVWGLLLSLPLLIRFFWKKAWSFLVRLVPAILIATQLIAMIALGISYSDPATRHSDSYLSARGIYDVAEGNNILVLVLDRLDNSYIEDVRRYEPAFFDRLDGFTRFTNHVTLYSQTFPSVTNMLTGQRHYFEENYADYLTRAWKTSPFIPGLREAGFACRFYMERGYTYSDAVDLLDIADNVTTGSVRIDKGAAAGRFLGLSAYRYLPLAVKPFFWTSTDAFGKLIDIGLDPPPYITDDPHFYQELEQRGLTVTHEDKSFVYIHLNGSHPPYNMDEYARETEPGQSSCRKQTKGSFHIVYSYLDRLKALGLYEGATIIITGDHGARMSDTQEPEAAMATALFVKRAGEAGSPLRYNEAPLSTDNFRATIYQAAGLDHGPYGSTYFEVAPEEFVLRQVFHRLYPSETEPERLLTYQILGDANDFNNWTLVAEEEILR